MQAYRREYKQWNKNNAALQTEGSQKAGDLANKDCFIQSFVQGEAKLQGENKALREQAMVLRRQLDGASRENAVLREQAVELQDELNGVTQELQEIRRSQFELKEDGEKRVVGLGGEADDGGGKREEAPGQGRRVLSVKKIVFGQDSIDVALRLSVLASSFQLGNELRKEFKNFPETTFREKANNVVLKNKAVTSAFVITFFGILIKEGIRLFDPKGG